jgi:CpeS-like protein
MDAMEFFQNSAGRWKSSRVTHHLAFKRSETGESEIVVETLTADDPEIIELCKMHEVEPSLSIGGSRVRWLGTMAWDKEGEENHEGQTVFAIVPDVDNPRQGRLLRERGYAEIMPVIGRFHLDEEEGLVLTTDYETMSSIERFWFSGSNMRMRTSTVKRFGGFSTASYCVESRIDAGVEGVLTETESVAPQLVSVLGW